MPGAWEINPTVLVAILHTEITSIAWAFGLRSLQIPGQVIALSGMPFDHARNTAAMRTIESGFDYLFFLDSDVIPPPDTILRLIRHQKPIISGIYYRRSPPEGLPVMIKNGGHYMDHPKTSLFTVDLVGTGCLLIHRSVLETLPPQRQGKHWFDWRVDMRGAKDTQGNPIPDGKCLSEDYTFCVHAQEHGYKIWVDPTIVCKHIGYAEAGHLSFKPLGMHLIA